MKNLLALTALICTLALTACNEAAKKPAEAAPPTEDEKTLYAIGVYLSRQVEPFDLKPEEIVHVQKGLADGAAGTKPMVTIEEYIPKIQALQMARMQAASETAAAAETAFLDKTATETGATKTASGMLIKHTLEGKGASPAATDQVSVNYAGRFTSGEEFDSSVKNGGPVTFPLDGVIPCWTEGVQLMKVGGKAQLTCPYNLAYGPNGKPPAIPAHSTLVFDVELLDIVKAPPPPK